MVKVNKKIVSVAICFFSLTAVMPHSDDGFDQYREWSPPYRPKSTSTSLAYFNTILIVFCLSKGGLIQQTLIPHAGLRMGYKFGRYA